MERNPMLGSGDLDSPPKIEGSQETRGLGPNSTMPILLRPYWRKYLTFLKI